MHKLAITIGLILSTLVGHADGAESPQKGTVVQAGQHILLGEAIPGLHELKKTDITLEFWIRPDQATVARTRVLLWLFSNKTGSDVAGIGLSCAAGKLQANVLGAKLTATGTLEANKWVHACLTIDTRKLNKVATLWVDGHRVDRVLVPHRWPTSFFYTRLMSDPWGNKRFFSGEIASIRLSSQVLYRENFTPQASWQPDDNTLLLIPGDQVRLK